MFYCKIYHMVIYVNGIFSTPITENYSTGQRQVYRQEGLRSFGRGYIPTVIGIFPYAGLDLFFAETARKYIQNTQSWAVNSGV